MQQQRFRCANVWGSCGLTLLLSLMISLGLTQPALAGPLWQSQPDTPTPTDTPAPPTDTPTDTPAPPAATDTPAPPTDTPTATPTDTPAPPTATPTATPTNTPVLVWQLKAVDSAGNVGQYTALALDRNGNPVISYADITKGDLKLVHCGNAICTVGNAVWTVDSVSNVGQYTALKVDSSGNPVISYYDVTNQDLKLVHCGNAICTTGNTIQTVDSVGNVGQYNSLALDSRGYPVISYYDATNADLKVAYCGNAACSSGNTIQAIDRLNDVGRYTALALDSTGKPVISYYDFTNGDLKVVHCSSSTCSSTIAVVDSSLFVGMYTSLVLDSSGNPVISYYNLTNQNLKLVKCGNATCTAGNSIQTVDSTLHVGWGTSLTLDRGGNPVVSYYDSFNQDLKLLRCGNATCTAGNTIQIVDSAGDVGQYVSLALDNYGNPLISYYDATNGDLKLAQSIDPTLPTATPILLPPTPTMTPTNTPIPPTPTNTPTLTPTSTPVRTWQLKTLDSVGVVGKYSSLALNSSGSPIISYLDATNGDLKVARCGNPTCGSGNTVQTVASTGYVGEYSSLEVASSGNPVISYYDSTNGDLVLVACGYPTCSSSNSFQTVDSNGVVGQYTSLALDRSGFPVISYYDVTNGDLKVAHCGNSTCSSGNSLVTVDSTGNVGMYTALVLDSGGNPVISYYDVTNGDLKVAHCGNPTCSSGNSLFTVVSAGDVGWYPSLVLDSSGNPLISYFDRTNYEIQLVRCSNPTCSSTNAMRRIDRVGDIYVFPSLALDGNGYPVISYRKINLQLFRCGHPTCDSGNSLITVDSTNLTGWSSSLAVNSKGDLAISYYDDNNGDLKLALFLDATLPTATPIPLPPTPTNTPTPPSAIASVDVGGEFSSLALDSSAKPIISYFDRTTQDLKLMKCGNATCTTGNTIATLDSAGDVGRHTALKLDSSGFPVISYYDQTNGNLKLVHCGNAACTAGNTLWTVDASAGDVGSHTALALDSNGFPVISYWDLTNRDLKLAHCTNATCTAAGGTITTVDSGGSVGMFTALALNSSGYPIISYLDDTNFDLRVVSCGNPACTAGNSFQAADNPGVLGLFTALALDSSGKGVISYYDDSNGDLKLVYCGNTTCTAGNVIRIVDSVGVVGKYTSLALTNSGKPVISYYDVGNRDLKVVFCGDTTCNNGNDIRTVDSAGDVGQYTALKLDSSGNAVISYYDFTNNKLKLARVPAGATAGGVAASAMAVTDTDAGGGSLDTAQPLTTTAVATTVDAAPAVVEMAGQTQRLFLPLVANNGTTAASDSASDDNPGAPAGEAAPQSAAVTSTAATTLTLTAVDPNVGGGSLSATQPLTTTALAAVITTSAPVSLPVAAESIVTATTPVSAPVMVATAPVVTTSAAVSAPVAMEATPVVSASAPISTAAAVTAPVVAAPPAVTTTQSLTMAEAGAAASDVNAAANDQNQQLFLPIITNVAALAGAALGRPGGMAGLLLVTLLLLTLVVRYRQRRKR